MEVVRLHHLRVGNEPNTGTESFKPWGEKKNKKEGGMKGERTIAGLR